MPARRRGACRHRLPDRPRDDGEGARFTRPAANSLDAVSDRDFALETLAAASIAAMHLSRLAEEIVLWTSPQFGFAKLSDRFATGSSIMPQKRNPRRGRTVRAKTGRISGAFVGLLMVMKGLPLAYAKDMQEDKEPVFDALAALKLGLAAMTGMVGDLERQCVGHEEGGRARPRHRHRPRRLAGAGGGTALPGGPSRDRANRRACRRQGKRPRETHFGRASLGRAENRRKASFSVLSVANSVKSRTSYGGAAPLNVRREAKRWIKRLKKDGLTR